MISREFFQLAKVHEETLDTNGERCFFDWKDRARNNECNCQPQMLQVKRQRRKRRRYT